MICSECNGKGYRAGRDGEEKCPECQGKGEFLPVEECRVASSGTVECSVTWQ